MSMNYGERKQKALEYLQQKRVEYGDCFHPLDAIAVYVGCEPTELFDWDNDSGPLQDLDDEGMVTRIGKDAFAAVGNMEWGM